MNEPRYGHFNQLVEVSIRMLEQKISIGEFEETLNRIIANIRAGYAELNKVELPSDISVEAMNEFKVVKESMSLFEIGVQEMRKYIDTKERQHLVTGLQMAQKANEILNAVIHYYDEPPQESTDAAD